MTGPGLRPVAFLVAMLGFGLRLDTSWQGAATTLLAIAAVLGALALRPPQRAFVAPDER
jgi:hypothetical protein